MRSVVPVACAMLNHPSLLTTCFKPLTQLAALLLRFVRRLQSLVTTTILSSIIASTIITSTYAEPTTAPEYSVKAAFLVAFVQYTTWPAHALEDEESPINICVLGHNPFDELLARTAAEQTSKRPIRVVTLDRPTTSRCHVAFVSRQQQKREVDWLAALKNKGTLTVGESGHSISRGAVVEFVVLNNRVRFEVSWSAMESSGIKLSSPLLASALKVHRDEVSP
jgi:hypothetical protein